MDQVGKQVITCSPLQQSSTRQIVERCDSAQELLDNGNRSDSFGCIYVVFFHYTLTKPSEDK